MGRRHVGPDQTHTGQERQSDGFRHNDGELGSLTHTPGHQAVRCPECQDHECDPSVDPMPLALGYVLFHYGQSQDTHQEPCCDDPEIAAQRSRR